MRYRANVVVRLKDGVLDPQGQTILQAARTLGFPDIRSIRVGKQFALDLEARDKAGAQALLDGLCRKLLSNPVIETYAFEILGSTSKIKRLTFNVQRSTRNAPKPKIPSAGGRR